MDENTAKLELALLNANSVNIDKTDMITNFTNSGLPKEVIFRMDSLWNYTKIIAGETFEVGKIIIGKIWEFVQENPDMVIGVAVGATIGALVNLVPFLGPILAPISMSIGAVIGGVAGHRLDQKQKGLQVHDGIVGISEDIISIAKNFFKLFAEIFNALKKYFTEK